MADPLAAEKAYLKEHRKELSEKYPGKYLLIKGQAVHGGFETYEQGVTAGARMFGAGPFLVRSVLRPEDPDAPSIPALSIGAPFVVRP